jgi:hypothetical protein
LAPAVGLAPRCLLVEPPVLPPPADKPRYTDAEQDQRRHQAGHGDH